MLPLILLALLAMALRPFYELLDPPENWEWIADPDILDEKEQQQICCDELPEVQDNASSKDEQIYDELADNAASYIDNQPARNELSKTENDVASPDIATPTLEQEAPDENDNVQLLDVILDYYYPADFLGALYFHALPPAHEVATPDSLSRSRRDSSSDESNSNWSTPPSPLSLADDHEPLSESLTSIESNTVDDDIKAVIELLAETAATHAEDTQKAESEKELAEDETSLTNKKVFEEFLSEEKPKDLEWFEYKGLRIHGAAGTGPVCPRQVFTNVQDPFAKPIDTASDHGIKADDTFELEPAQFCRPKQPGDEPTVYGGIRGDFATELLQIEMKMQQAEWYEEGQELAMNSIPQYVIISWKGPAAIYVFPCHGYIQIRAESIARCEVETEAPANNGGMQYRFDLSHLCKDAVLCADQAFPKIHISYKVYTPDFPQGFPSTAAEITWCLDQTSEMRWTNCLRRYAPYVEDHSLRALLGREVNVQPNPEPWTPGVDAGWSGMIRAGSQLAKFGPGATSFLLDDVMPFDDGFLHAQNALPVEGVWGEQTGWQQEEVIGEARKLTADETRPTLKGCRALRVKTRGDFEPHLRAENWAKAIQKANSLNEANVDGSRDKQYQHDPVQEMLDERQKWQESNTDEAPFEVEDYLFLDPHESPFPLPELSVYKDTDGNDNQDLNSWYEWYHSDSPEHIREFENGDLCACRETDSVARSAFAFQINEKQVEFCDDVEDTFNENPRLEAWLIDQDSTCYEKGVSKKGHLEYEWIGCSAYMASDLECSDNDMDSYLPSGIFEEDKIPPTYDEFTGTFECVEVASTKRLRRMEIVVRPIEGSPQWLEAREVLRKQEQEEALRKKDDSEDDDDSEEEEEGQDGEGDQGDDKPEDRGDKPTDGADKPNEGGNLGDGDDDDDQDDNDDAPDGDGSGLIMADDTQGHGEAGDSSLQIHTPTPSEQMGICTSKDNLPISAQPPTQAIESDDLAEWLTVGRSDADLEERGCDEAGLLSHGRSQARLAMNKKASMKQHVRYPWKTSRAMAKLRKLESRQQSAADNLDDNWEDCEPNVEPWVLDWVSTASSAMTPTMQDTDKHQNCKLAFDGPFSALLDIPQGQALPGPRTDQLVITRGSNKQHAQWLHLGMPTILEQRNDSRFYTNVANPTVAPRDDQSDVHVGESWDLEPATYCALTRKVLGGDYDGQQYATVRLSTNPQSAELWYDYRVRELRPQHILIKWDGPFAIYGFPCHEVIQFRGAYVHHAEVSEEPYHLPDYPYHIDLAAIGVFRGTQIYSNQPLPKICLDYKVYTPEFPNGFLSTGAQITWALRQDSPARYTDCLERYANAANEKSYRQMLGSTFTILPTSQLDSPCWLGKVRAGNRLTKFGPGLEAYLANDVLPCDEGGITKVDRLVGLPSEEFWALYVGVQQQTRQFWGASDDEPREFIQRNKGWASRGNFHGRHLSAAAWEASKEMARNAAQGLPGSAWETYDATLKLKEFAWYQAPMKLDGPADPLPYNFIGPLVEPKLWKDTQGNIHLNEESLAMWYQEHLGLHLKHYLLGCGPLASEGGPDEIREGPLLEENIKLGIPDHRLEGRLDDVDEHFQRKLRHEKLDSYTWLGESAFDSPVSGMSLDFVPGDRGRMLQSGPIPADMVPPGIDQFLGSFELVAEFTNEGERQWFVRPNPIYRASAAALPPSPMLAVHPSVKSNRSHL